jgi:Carbohydrate esterase, sialic acid-specific acetylesterase
VRTSIKLLVLAIFLAFWAIDCHAQLSINMPVERSVFQRVNNKATIQIGGVTDVFLSQIQVKLEVINGGIPISWTTINTNIEPGEFRAQIADVEAGWYELEVRGMYNGNQVGFDEVEKVGIGEVFVISGQSNAQGGRYPDPEYSTQIYYGAQDDRVNGINFSTNDPNFVYPIPNISNILPITDLAPTGKASWCWALLGDHIAQNWNVPVLFLNTAITSTTMLTWSQAANNNSSPYIYMKKSFDYYNKIFGIRAILWHQGESDTAYNFDSNPQNRIDFENNFMNLISKSREHLGGNVSWVIAKVSRLAYFLTSNNLLECQQNIATNYPNCFLGPSTDGIQPGQYERDGEVHFRAEGFIDLSDSWYNSINNSNFINNSNPISATNNLQVVDNQFIFGNSIAPRLGIVESISSGDWHDPAIWSSGFVPNSLNEIIITEGHTVVVDNKTIYVKNLILNGIISLENGGNVVLVE